MEYKVELEQFQGPLDLLLHLIKEKELDLKTLDLSLLTKQYLAYVMTQNNEQLEVASEYLVMAANLVEMKSRMLLPKEAVVIDDEYQEDPREALIKRLIEYKRYKDVLDDFRMLHEQRQSIYIKAAHPMDEYVVDTSTMIPDNLEIYDLMKAMQRMYQRKILSKPLDTHIAKKDISVDERTVQIRDYFKVRKGQKIKIDELFERKDRFYFVVTFISLLVLAKDKELEIVQDDLFGDIYIEGKL